MPNQRRLTSGVILDNTTVLKAGSILFSSRSNEYYYRGLSSGREEQNLSNFIEALVLHDKIYLDRETLDVEHPLVQLLLERVGHLIKWQDFSTTPRSEILRRSRQLAESRGSHGVFIKIIEQMPSEFWEDYYRDEIATSWPRRDYDHLVFEGISLIDEDLKPTMAAALDHYYSNEKFRSKFPDFFPKGFVFQRQLADEESLYRLLLPFIALIIRGYFHLMTSIETGIPYQPLAARAPFIHHELYYSETKHVLIRQILLREFENIRSRLSSQANEILQTRIFQTEVPIVLAYVLKRSKSRNEILDRALELRGSRNLTRYRRFCNELEQRLVSEEVSASELLNIKNDLEKIAYDATSGSILQRTSISIGIPPGISLGLPITGWRKNKGLLFLYDLQAVTRSIQSLDAQFARLFKGIHLAGTPLGGQNSIRI